MTPHQKRTQNQHLLAKEGIIILLIALIFTALAFLISTPLGIVFLFFVAFTLYFFRNPKRQSPLNPDWIYSPADGTVIAVSEAKERYFSNEPQLRVTVFMSPFNVHVNRSPATGVVSATHYQKGKFLAAFSENASLENEQSALELILPTHQRLVFVQIAGWLARRIVTYPEKGESLNCGQIFGVIRFGSRMDIYLPLDAKLKVTLNQKVKAFETVLAHF